MHLFAQGKLQQPFLLTHQRKFCCLNSWPKSSPKLCSMELVPGWSKIQGYFKQKAESCIKIQTEVWGIPFRVYTC